MFVHDHLLNCPAQSRRNMQPHNSVSHTKQPPKIQKLSKGTGSFVSLPGGGSTRPITSAKMLSIVTVAGEENVAKPRIAQLLGVKRPRGTMGDCQGWNFKTVISLHREGNNSEVHYKNDGTRFGSESTIKLNVETPYILTVCFRPAQFLDNVTLLGSCYTAKEKSRDHASSTYCISWSSLGMPVTKRGSREKIPLSLDIRNVGELLVSLQAKFYRQHDTDHATWGTALHHIDLDCLVSPSSGNIIVNKESFR